MANRTLDISDPQVLVNYPLDPNGFTQHHRILLHKLAPGRWVVLTPDYDIQIADLNALQHTVLGRREPFPDHLVPVIYASDEIPRNELERFRRRAKATGVVLGSEDPQEVAARVWVFADPKSNKVGELVELAHRRYYRSRQSRTH